MGRLDQGAMAVEEHVDNGYQAQAESEQAEHDTGYHAGYHGVPCRISEEGHEEEEQHGDANEPDQGDHTVLVVVSHRNVHCIDDARLIGRVQTRVREIVRQMRQAARERHEC